MRGARHTRVRAGRIASYDAVHREVFEARTHAAHDHGDRGADAGLHVSRELA